MAQDKKQWYVLRAISGKEAKVKEMLDAACNNVDFLHDHLFQVLVPTEKIYVKRGNKKVLKDKNLFSGYVFVQCELTGEVEDYLSNTTNVIDFLRSRESGRKPEPVPEAQIRSMLGAAADEESRGDGSTVNDYVLGETVKVANGPFTGFTGDVSYVDREKHKLTVMVKVFGRETPLELDNSEVERVSK